MKVFASWSGRHSQLLAEAFRDWLPGVLQESEVFISSKDIGAGKRWSSEIGGRLSEIKFGVVFVTPESINAPWLQFEAGALSRELSNLVVPVRSGVSNVQLQETPLGQFQSVEADRDGILNLVRDMNKLLSRPLAEQTLDHTFQMWWPELAKRFGEAADATGTTNEPPAQSTTENLLVKLLEEQRRLIALVQEAILLQDTDGAPTRSSIFGRLRRESRPLNFAGFADEIVKLRDDPALMAAVERLLAANRAMSFDKSEAGDEVPFTIVPRSKDEKPE